MKSNIKILLLILIVINSTSYSQNKKLNLVGNWNMTDYWGNKSDFILSEDNYASMSVNGEFIDGKNFIIHGGKNDGQKGEMKYLINYGKTPIELDIIAMKENKEMGRILGVIKPLNENEFLMIWSFDGKRNSDFSENNNEQIMTVKRKG
ncbi:hypothetical protein AAEO57_20705 [Flavobacterium sp. DGU38]|uniref:Lipocalin-like domain-containing protein n=1 Tax=Flavobacterium calami TaxID=3139144 RepID=A0ABU9IUS1_9FLAO